MQDTSNLLRSLEADVAELQSLVKNLDSQEKALREAVTRLDAVHVIPGVQTPKKVILAPETNR